MSTRRITIWSINGIFEPEGGAPQTTLEPGHELVDGQTVSGLRARPLPIGPSLDRRMQSLLLPSALVSVLPSRGGLRVFYPGSYNDPFVVDLGEQRVILRPV